MCVYVQGAIGLGMGALQSIVHTFLLERESVLSFPPLAPLFIFSSVFSLSLLFLSLSPLFSLSLPLARTLSLNGSQTLCLNKTQAGFKTWPVSMPTRRTGMLTGLFAISGYSGGASGRFFGGFGGDFPVVFT